MATPSIENSDQPTALSTEADHCEEDTPLPNSLNHEGAELKVVVADEEVKGFSDDEVRGILEIIASTGKFWHDWEKLKNMISFHLKQVLSEYPEAKMTIEEQNAKLGETYPYLVKRLDEALHSFYEGPPFTLQRLCEILLSARSIYPILSKLALALEKNLLVTSILTVCLDPYPQAMQKQDEPNKQHEGPQLQAILVENGIEPMAGDVDEIMTEVQEAVVDDDMTMDIEAFQGIVGSSEQNSTPAPSS
ncbi:uncharacterized protein LOC126665363 [Mercurialis annua]|uniref:uncharacterized protein LOC126665363 n=1 Tax=Mercurialis annua TaxID=3986 RepID=UPI00215DD737|nr:uncharacterized protein LOC126665363 [Mercurialis annua]